MDSNGVQNGKFQSPQGGSETSVEADVTLAEERISIPSRRVGNWWRLPIVFPPWDFNPLKAGRKPSFMRPIKLTA